jgi:hypothetical protein
MKTPVVCAQQRWEYMSLVRKTETTLVNDLNQIGQEGWELAAIVHGRDAKGELCWTAFLKRPSAGPMKAGAADAGGTATSTSGATAARPGANPPGFDLSGDTFDIKKE